MRVLWERGDLRVSDIGERLFLDVATQQHPFRWTTIAYSDAAILRHHGWSIQ